MDNEIKGEGNSLNYTFRMHDPRIGRFFVTDPLEKKYPFYSPYQFGGNDPISSVELEGLEPSKVNTPIQEPYKGGISNYEAEESKGTVPGGYSTSQRWKMGGYTITPNYVKTSENTSELSHYTASVQIKDIADGMKDVVRTDWIIPYAKLGEFKEKVQLFEGSANLMYGANAKLSDWQINYLNGNKKDALTGYLKEQWSDPIVVVTSLMATFPSRLRVNSKVSFTRRNYKYTVRSHAPDINAPRGSTSATKPIFRVERKSTIRINGQGTGTEYMDIHGNWHHESTLKQFNRDGTPNASYNATVAEETHIHNKNTFKY